MRSRLFGRLSDFVALAVAASLVSISVPAFAGDDDDAADIVEKALERNSLEFDSGKAVMHLVIEDQNGDRSNRSMEVNTKEIDGRLRTLIELTAPDEIKGQSFLFAENEKGQDDVWMFVPAFKVTRRIEGNKKNGAFLGSHFTYNDLESRDVEQASYDKKDDDKIGEHPVHVIESTPKASVESEYGKVVVYVRKKDDVPLKFKFYDDSGDLLKTLFVEKLDETGSGKKYIKQMQMRSEKGGYTRIEIESIDTDAEFPDAKFSKEQLGK